MSLEGCQVLVVDDQEDARDMVARMLKAAGANVVTATSVHDALRQLETAPIHVLLADLGMPGADGYDLIREVRTRNAETGQHLPAAAITAYASTEDQGRALAAGFDAHLPKPTTPAALLETVASIWRGARRRDRMPNR
jgi:CheY-like chemotaxis protein